MAEQENREYEEGEADQHGVDGREELDLPPDLADSSDDEIDDPPNLRSDCDSGHSTDESDEEQNGSPSDRGRQVGASKWFEASFTSEQSSDWHAAETAAGIGNKPKNQEKDPKKIGKKTQKEPPLMFYDGFALAEAFIGSVAGWAYKLGYKGQGYYEQCAIAAEPKAQSDAPAGDAGNATHETLHEHADVVG